MRSRLIIGLIRNRNILKKGTETYDESFSVQEFRDRTEKVSRKLRLPKNISTEKIKIGNIEAEWIIPDLVKSDGVLFYIHGGGFISGSCNTHRTHVAKFAAGTGLRSLVFNYRLAPEHPFPAGLNDCIDVYKWLMTRADEEGSGGIIIGGESAGGTLALSLLLALKEEGVKLPKGVFSISPATDLSCRAASFSYNAGKDIAPEGSWGLWTGYYTGSESTDNPLLSPQFGNYSGCPPLYFCIGTHEIHYDDCLNAAEKARKDGVDVTLRKWPGMVHAFPLLSPLFPEARKALNDICRFCSNL